MKITDILSQETMILSLKATSKEAAIDEMIAKLADEGKINDVSLFKSEIMKREQESSTGIGDGIAMPHAKTKAVNTPTVVFAKSEAGLDYDSLDGQPAHLFFMIAATDGANQTHLETLAALSRLLIHPDFVAKLRNAKTTQEVVNLFDQEQGEAEAEQGVTSQNNEAPFVVAVTACPTGIAHTYMAEDALKNKAKEMGVDIRVETNGSDGAKNKLTADEIERASGVIVAADKKVEMARFDGKHVLETPVSDGIRKPEELINKAIAQEAPVYHHSGEKDSDASDGKRVSIGSRIYKDLMNGISHMLPFVVGGGILLAFSFLLEQYFPQAKTLTDMLGAISGSETGAFMFLIPILSGFIAMSIADRPGLMPGMVGGLLAATSNAGFLGGLLAGFLAGYVVLGLKVLFSKMPKTLEGLKPILIYPVLGLLITGGLMYLIFDPIFANINTFLVDQLQSLGTANAVILGTVLGGMMAIDMGGPFNKAAYTFAIGVFTTTGNTDGAFMAAVMAGGMVPPLAIAMATSIFKKKFTPDERQAGLTNYVLGLSFITEGAIPFAAADPLRVITSCVLGSAIAGGLTQFWHINVPAPHGGIFVVGLANHAILFLLAILIGTVISGLLYGFWKKEI
ncbi:PTS fructose transporter subunit IIABC [Listeria booriae]|uniref:PTS fructose transporter subunit IIABC n=1 Tax=Listeria booriae TaxID=1552123 RepID=UPI00162810D7|nr:PTS fructose transporter subunit IIABC [Listeria booriae]MBC1974483.1 PTS transporter subunit EIIA [Listeria booriae]MBC1982374.1 PTS transporter subunit EIIA [Listeria booriae]MBC2034083.1 PTS transporter subunit EIIA [Listeria booriae]MBC2049208.1 PTS transporter subunit EIIA [Listeria booriae]MBC2266099.1 PTS transporter subunit EIIA [Listeria booriae]